MYLLIGTDLKGRSEVMDVVEGGRLSEAQKKKAVEDMLPHYKAEFPNWTFIVAKMPEHLR